MCKNAEMLLAGISKHSHGRHVDVLCCTEGFSVACSRAWEDDGCQEMPRWMQASCQKTVLLRVPLCRYPKEIKYYILHITHYVLHIKYYILRIKYYILNITYYILRITY
jgi:uncharacterized membrane protein YhdT